MTGKISVTRSSMPPFEEYIEEIRPLWDSRWLTNAGEKHQALEAALCAYLAVPNISLCVNGHLALEGILDAFSLTGEVITTPFTFVSTTNAILRRGLTPVFCDINDRDFTIDVDKLEALITEKTTAILPVHVYGNLCDDAAIRAIADRYGLRVIYDAAHAFGVTKDGKSAAGMGDASMFSFHATKVFHTIEGGAAVFRDPAMQQRFNQLKNFGIVSPEELGMAGGNSKMNEFSAAMGLCNLRHIDAAIAARKAAVLRYRARLADIPGLQLSMIQPGVESNYAYFPIIVHPAAFGCTRDAVCDALAAQGVGARKYFYPLTGTVQDARCRFNPQTTPVARSLSEKVLCLPLYEELDTNAVDRICDCILSLRR